VPPSSPSPFPDADVPSPEEGRTIWSRACVFFSFPVLVPSEIRRVSMRHLRRILVPSLPSRSAYQTHRTTHPDRRSADSPLAEGMIFPTSHFLVPSSSFVLNLAVAIIPAEAQLGLSLSLFPGRALGPAPLLLFEIFDRDGLPLRRPSCRAAFFFFFFLSRRP